MSALELIIEELKVLPPDKLEDAARYVHKLAASDPAERNTLIETTATMLTAEDVKAMDSAIREACEQIDERSW